MKLLLVLPILIPLFSAIASLIAWHWRVLQQCLAVGGTAALLASGLALLRMVWYDGIQAVQVGSWPAPFGISLVADLLSAMMVVLTGLIGLAVAVYSLLHVEAEREAYGYYALLHVLLMGVSGAFLTGDIFNLYVWFEVMLIASFVLLTLGGERHQLEGGIKYTTLNLLSSAIFLAAVGILYSVAGSLNMADLADVLRTSTRPGLVTTVAMLFLVAFGIKAAVFPLFFWLPASYHTPPVAVSAIFAGLLTKVGVYALIRVFTLLFVGNVSFTHTLLLLVAGLTMVTGVLGAAAQNDFRRILSFHIVSQIGYMILGLALFTPLALAGAVFYIAHHIIVKTNLFLVSGLIFHLRGSFQLQELGGVYRQYPLVAVLFAIPAFSLAGIPPLSGFWAKFILIKAGIETGQHAVVAVALAVGLLTLYSMTKIWAEVFWKEAGTLPDAAHRLTSAEATSWKQSWPLLLPIIFLAAITVGIGFLPHLLFELSHRAAEQLLDQSLYIEAVLGG